MSNKPDEFRDEYIFGRVAIACNSIKGNGRSGDLLHAVFDKCHLVDISNGYLVFATSDLVIMDILTDTGLRQRVEELLEKELHHAWKLRVVLA